jgi:hypothetical protein
MCYPNLRLGTFRKTIQPDHWLPELLRAGGRSIQGLVTEVSEGLRSAVGPVNREHANQDNNPANCQHCFTPSLLGSVFHIRTLNGG